MSFRLWLGPGALDLPLAESGANPLIVLLLFLLRCLVPLALMLGLSFVLRRFGLITEPAQPPAAPPPGGEDRPPGPTQGGTRDGQA
ncbi:MAG: hypothetical protein MUO23_02000 [Anaerolineales bacterium]|nr:hypothetical protein [Anaerolineales bacterium]